MNKATRAQVKEHNRRLVMRALFEQVADNRAALALETGLTKPTIGTIIGELIRTGYVTEDGYGTSGSSGGKRPTIVRFISTARQVIGVSVRRDEITAGLAYLDGTIIARHHITLSGEIDILENICYTINALIAQSDAPILCVGIGVPGIVDSDIGVVVNSSILGWDHVELAKYIRDRYAMPCYVSNSTALITRIQVKQSNHNTRQLVTVSIGDIIEIGSTFGEDVYQHGGDISHLAIPDSNYCVADLQWQNVKTKIEAIIRRNQDTVMANRPFSYLLLRRAILLKEPEALELLDVLAHNLAYVYQWIIGLMRPSEIVLTGSLSALGHALLEKVDHKLRTQLSAHLMSNLRLTIAQSDFLSMQGAVVFGLQEELGIV